MYFQLFIDPATLSFNTATILLSLILMVPRGLPASGFRLPPAVPLALSICAAFVVIAYATLIVLAQFVGYADHLQVSVASVAWLSVRSFPIYPDLTGGDLYGLIYGPLLFWLNGLAMRLAPSIAVVTILSAGVLVCGIALTWRILRPKVSSVPAGLLLLALLVEQLIPHGFVGFWNRGEPFLYLIAALSMAATRMRVGVAPILIIGALAGCAADIKLTALFCTAPAFFILLAREDRWRARFLATGYAAVAGAAMLGFPMLIDSSVIRLYRDYLGLASGHGLSAILLGENLYYAVAMLMPAILVLTWRRPRLSREDKWFFTGLLMSVAAETVLGSKVMSGPYHLIPLSPWAVYAAVRAMQAPSNIDRNPASLVNQLAIVFGVLFLANLTVMGDTGHGLREALSDVPRRHAQRSELVALMNAHPDAEVGVAGLDTYRRTFIRPLQVMRNDRLHLDVGAWMDLREGGVDEAKAARLIETCGVPAWIIPNGEAPFSLPSHYTRQALFSDAFRAAFARRYTISDAGNFYSVWVCR